MNRKTFFIIISLLPFFWACISTLEGDRKINLPPETHCIVDTILRTGSNRFKTYVEIKWWGDDRDGFVKGYEYSFNKINWHFTTSQDSTFLVNIPGGSDTFDFRFYVRSVDNLSMVDPTPASLSYPVKNSPPAVDFEYFAGSAGNPSRYPVNSFPVLKFSWNGTDPDGYDNLDHYEIYLNDTLGIPVLVDYIYNSVIIQANDLTGSTSPSKVFQGNSQVLNSSFLGGMKLNDTNFLIIRAVDIVGEKSDFRQSYKVFVRKPVSKVLLVNAYSNSQQYLLRENEYKQWMNSCGINNYDITRVNEVSGMNYTQLAPDNITQSKIFELFDVIIWFGKNINYSLSLAQKTTDGFFANGGRMFLAIEITASIDPQAGYLAFTPVDSLVSFPAGVNGFRLNKGADVLPLVTSWPDLRTDTNAIIPAARPFYENIHSIPLYDANIIQTSASGQSPWNGKSTIMAKKVNNGKTVFIISSIELHNLNGNNNISDLCTKLFREELNIN